LEKIVRLQGRTKVDGLEELRNKLEEEIRSHVGTGYLKRIKDVKYEILMKSD